MDNSKIDKELARSHRRVEDLKSQISSLNQQLREAEIAYSAQLDLIKLINRPLAAVKAPALRADTELDKIRLMLAAASKPLHVGEIAKNLGKEDSKNVRASLAGSLGAYARRGQIFSRPAPNTFGLIDRTYGDDDVSDLIA